MTNPSKAKLSSVRTQNTSVILRQLWLHAPLSRAELAGRTDLTRSTVSDIINDLLAKNLVRETEFSRGEIGRPGMSLELNPRGGSAIGVEIGADFIVVVLTDFVAQILWKERATVDCGASPDCVFENAERLIHQALQRAEAAGLAPLGLGLGIHGVVDNETGTLMFAPNLHWQGVPFRARWEEQFSLPVIVENDANAAALSEYYFGTARKTANFVYLSTGIGLGGGIIIDGKLYRGHHGYAGEIGHTKVQPETGILCGCGQRGCLETVVGPRQVVDRVKQSLAQAPESFIWTLADNEATQVTFEIILQAAEAGDPVALAALGEVGYWLGVGVANLINIFNPQLVVLGGVLKNASHLLIPICEEVINNNALALARQGVKLVASANGENACVLGGVALVLDTVLRKPAF